MANKKNIQKNNGKNDPAVFVKQSNETELGALCRRLELAIGNCNRLKDKYTDLAKVKKALLTLEATAHAMWLEEALSK